MSASTHRHDEMHRGLVPTDQLGTGSDASGDHMLVDDQTYVLLGSLVQLASAPGAPAEGDSYYDTATHKSYTWDGSTWQAWW